MLELALIGLHLGTVHLPSVPPCDLNPGIYVQTTEGATLGVYRNSECRTSVYTGVTFETADQRWAVTLGAVTGYRIATVVPLVVPSVRLPISDSVAARASLLLNPMGGASGVHLSLETKW